MRALAELVRVMRAHSNVSSPRALVPVSIFFLASGAFGACSEEFTLDCPNGVTTQNTCINQAGAAGSSGTGGGVGASGAASTACGPAEQPDDAVGIFVDATAPSGGTGTRARPFASLAEAASITGLERATLYLRQGSYDLATTLDMPSLTGGLVLDGGWGENWQRDCSPDAASKTLVRGQSSAASPVLRLRGGSLTLRKLTVQTADLAPPALQAQSGASLIAVHVAGPTSLLVESSVLRAGKAGDGGAAPPGTQVSGLLSCNGINDCQTGASVALPTASGSTNAATLTPERFTPGDGQDGQPGTSGENGTRDAQSDGKENSSCVACNGVSQSSCEAAGSPFINDTTSADGRCGCGGKGGSGGPGGRGGGASIALWVSSPTTQLTITASQLIAGDGGNGSKGTPGGNGSSGADGVAGLSLCRVLIPNSACTWNAETSTCNIEPSDSAATTPGKAGGLGGRGGPGGSGGPGAGGPSYALAMPTTTILQVSASSLKAGLGGLDGNGSTRAEATQQKTY